MSTTSRITRTNDSLSNLSLTKLNHISGPKGHTKFTSRKGVFLDVGVLLRPEPFPSYCVGVFNYGFHACLYQMILLRNSESVGKSGKRTVPVLVGYISYSSV